MPQTEIEFLAFNDAEERDATMSEILQHIHVTKVSEGRFTLESDVPHISFVDVDDPNWND